MLKRFSFLFLIVYTSIGTLTAQDKYSQVKVWTGPEGLMELSALGVAVDHGATKKGVWFTGEFSQTELQKIQNAGYATEVLIDDVQEYYRQQSNAAPRSGGSRSHCDNGSVKNYPVPANFSLGNMGGYFTYADMLGHLDNMYSLYPNLITQKAAFTTDSTHEGRPVYWLKISDNPTQDETEPEMIYTALHHAREPMSMSQLIYYMYYLLENYTTDAEVQYLVDNTELFFVPCVNPDGYIHNETTDPNGGGMWRLNRRQNFDGSVGVDLNRNYGHEWGHDNVGSSDIPGDQTYRGIGPFSEPETSIIRDFCESREFKIAYNYHSYGNLLIHPWGYVAGLMTPDSTVFQRFGETMTRQNRYAYGTGNITVGYIVNGDSDDWFYGEETTKDKIIAYTPEVGPRQWTFWPPSTEIIDLAKGAMWQNLAAAHLLLNYAEVNDLSPGYTGQLQDVAKYKIECLGLDTPGSYTVSVNPLDNFITFTTSQQVFNNMQHLEERIDSFAYTLNPTITAGQEYRYELSVDNGSFTFTDTITKIYGVGGLVVDEPGDNLNQWSTTGWGVSNTIFRSPPSSITDSPGGDYPNNSHTTIQLNKTIDLSNAIDAMFTFYGRWALEANYDFVQVEASTDGGVSWEALCGKYTSPGSIFQAAGEPVYHGGQVEWVQEEISLKDLVGNMVNIRFEFDSDNWTNGDGFYFDDLEVRVISDEVQASFTSDNLEICTGTMVNFTSTTLGDVSHEWLLDGVSFDTQATASQTFTAVGTYTVSLVASNIFGTDTAEKVITVFDEAPTGDFTSDINSLEVSFTDQTNASDTWHWDFGDGNVACCSNPDPVHTYLLPGTYNVCLSTENVCGSDTTCHEIVVESVSGLNSLHSIDYIRVYPSLVQREFYIEITEPSTDKLEISVLNLLGQRIEQRVMNLNQKTKMAFDLGDQPAGVYLVKIEGLSGRMTEKLIRVD